MPQIILHILILKSTKISSWSVRRHRCVAFRHWTQPRSVELLGWQHVPTWHTPTKKSLCSVVQSDL